MPVSTHVCFLIKTKHHHSLTEASDSPLQLINVKTIINVINVKYLQGFNKSENITWRKSEILNFKSHSTEKEKTNKQTETQIQLNEKKKSLSKTHGENHSQHEETLRKDG